MIIQKRHIAYLIFFMILCYIISPWFFEKKLLFNELLSAFGLILLAYKRFKIGTDAISLAVTMLLGWGVIHMIVSVYRTDGIYYYLRNLVLLYSILTFFIGYYLYPYLRIFLIKIHQFLKLYIVVLLFVPVSKFLFERFGMSTLFPSIVRNVSNKFLLPLLIILNFIYSITYSSLTALLIAILYIILLAVPGYTFFKQLSFLFLLIFAVVFIYLIPNLNLISLNYSYTHTDGIYDVIRSHPLLSLDGNSTWRLVLWEQILIDKFPENIFGIGFGTPMLKYFPIEDYNKIPQLPYVLGAHNSFIYLFGRLGIVYVILTLMIYRKVFKEYFYYKRYFYTSGRIWVFWSFMAITVIALFNPVLESPVFSGAYWFFLGLVAYVIKQRKTEELVSHNLAI